MKDLTGRLLPHYRSDWVQGLTWGTRSVYMWPGTELPACKGVPLPNSLHQLVIAWCVQPQHDMAGCIGGWCQQVVVLCIVQRAPRAPFPAHLKLRHIPDCELDRPCCSILAL